MLKKLLQIMFLSYILCINTFAQASKVTYEPAWGRFGDQLFTYCKAKWISVKYNIPLLYKPFLFSDKLILHETETYFDQKELIDLKGTVKINNEFSAPIRQKDGFLYVTNLFFNPSVGDFEYNFDYNTTVENFVTELKKIIKPRIQLPEFKLPEGMLSIAVHVRKGSGTDGALLSEQIYKQSPDKYWPMKFPPDQFYIDQILKLAQVIGDKQLYVYIFTDDKNPKNIVNRYKEKIHNPNILFDCRASTNQVVNEILEDFFAMAQFDYLIRPQSAYSICAQLIGKHKIVLYPRAGHWQGNKLIITDVGMMKH